MCPSEYSAWPRIRLPKIRMDLKSVFFTGDF
jgi:hypothetical protein